MLVLVGLVGGLLFSFVYFRKSNLDKQVVDTDSDFSSSSSIIQLYKKEKFRVLKVIRLKDVDVLIATEKGWTEAPDACGGFSESPCYFFTEPLYVTGAPDSELIARYNGNERVEVRYEKNNSTQPWGYVELGTVRSVNDHAITFKASEGGGGGTWKLDLQTKQFSVVGEIKLIEDGEGGF